MSSIQKRVVVLLFFLLALSLGFLFWPFLYHNVLYPFAMALWLLLRIFVLSIDQQYYWGGLIAIILLLFLRKLAKQSARSIEQVNTDNLTSNLKEIEQWRNFFILFEYDNNRSNILKQELVTLLIKVYASKQGIRPDFRLADDIKSGKIALPDNIRTFLFPIIPTKPKNVIEMGQQLFKKLLNKDVFQTSRQKQQQFYQGIFDVLSYMESFLENNDDAQ
jgi:hypothetical protein